jgi:hypothetical protein
MTEATLQNRLRSADMFNPKDEDLQDKAADAIDTLLAEVARLEKERCHCVVFFNDGEAD